MKIIKYLWIFSLIVTTTVLNAQILEFKIHDRGMLHETVYNTGDIGRPWTTGEDGNTTITPVMEWPSRSATIVDGTRYSGQHNLLGGGMYMAANLDGSPGQINREYALCGAVGTGSGSETILNRWSFPLYMTETENFPLLPNGTLNPDYIPDEAEEIIVASWATPIGVTVTRTSRSWSYPDFDDMIIYEYELEYTGDTDGNPATIERTETLKDFMALFIWGFGPSMYGYQRHYSEWKYEGGLYRADQNNFWDSDLWLSFNMNLRTNITDATIFAKREPNKDKFLEFASTGKNGGGLGSPQAPGYCVLYYDTTHLAFIDTIESPRNESEVTNILRTSTTFGPFEIGPYYELDENYHMKQPYSNKVSTGNTRSSKMTVESINPTKRWSGVYSPGSTTWPVLPDPRWIGRGAYPYRQSADAAQKHTVFGPYTLEHGDKIEFSFAEVVGYGAQPGKVIEGGQTLVQWAATPSWNRPIKFGDETVTTAYIDSFGYPDYVNSDVITVTDVAKKAFEAYLGIDSLSLPVWPEDNPRDGIYQLPIPVPAPIVAVENTVDGKISLKWTQAAEAFSFASGTLTKYYVCRADAGMGPWVIIDSIEVGDMNFINTEGLYEYIDTDSIFKLGETRFYSVLSVDENGNTSGRTNIDKHEKNVRSVDQINEVFVAPNPFNIKSGFGGQVGAEDNIGFYGLPERCTIRIFSYAGQLIETIEHDDPVYTTAWLQVTRNEQEIASGIYIYVITTPQGDKKSGKFIVIK